LLLDLHTIPKPKSSYFLEELQVDEGWVSRQFLDRQFLDWVRDRDRDRVRVRVRVRVAVQELMVQELSCNRGMIQVFLFVCLGFNGTFSTNRLYRAITVG